MLKVYRVVFITLALVTISLIVVMLSLQNRTSRNTEARELTVGELRTMISSDIMKSMVKARPRYKFLLEPKVEISSSHERWTSVVLVKSARTNKDRRNAIRETWASVKVHNGSRLHAVFIIGVAGTTNTSAKDSIFAENDKYKDILLIDILDTTSHIPDKTLAGMQWAAETLPDHWIYSSADDDMSLHVPNFVNYIDSTVAKYSGMQPALRHFATNLPIMCVYSYQKKDWLARDPQSKWYMPRDQYPGDTWPPYCRGGWYSMTVGLAEELFKISRWMKHLHLDDVWITGLMRIKYSATVSSDEAIVMDSFLDAAPLSQRSEWQLQRNLLEAISEVIVSHAWGNIAGENVNVTHELRKNWKKWSAFFQM